MTLWAKAPRKLSTRSWDYVKKGHTKALSQLLTSEVLCIRNELDVH